MKMENVLPENYDIFLARPYYHTHLITPVLGIGYIASSLKAQGFKVKIIDGINLGISNEEIAKAIPEKSIVGLTLLSAFLDEARDLINLLKKKNCVTIVGGPHAICLPEHTLEYTGCDYVLIGEGEIVMAELLKEIKKGNFWPDIKGVYHKKSQTITKAPLIENLDSLPFPDWEQMDPRQVKKAPHGGVVKNFPVGVIMTTRGCPYGCTFCASPYIWERKIRYRSPENVLDEMEYLIKNFGVKEIHFEDDNLTLKRSHAEGICRGIIKRGLKISWATPNGIRADFVDRELLLLMKESGYYAATFGVESADPQILINIKKSEKLEAITKAINIASSLGLMTQGFFILGLPGETMETARRTIDYAKNSRLDKAQFLILELLPGSEIYEKYINEQGKKYDSSFRGYTRASLSICELTPEQLKKLQGEAFREFFRSPRRIIKMLRHIRPSQLGFVFKRLKDFIFT